MKTAASLLIRDLELNVHLGWPENEREETQTVKVTLDIWFPHPPRACETDDLKDTFCYDKLIEVIRDKIATRHFRLVEHLSFDIYHTVKPLLPEKSRVIVRLSKHPNIEGLTGGVCFSYWDDI